MLTLYHNQNRSKARGAVALLDERGVDYTIHDYIADPLDAATLTELVAMVGVDPAATVRAPLHDTGAAAVVAHLVAHPADMQRPIAVLDGRAVIGRPSERVLDLLD